jgi:hypothetical protein
VFLALKDSANILLLLFPAGHPGLSRHNIVVSLMYVKGFRSREKTVLWSERSCLAAVAPPIRVPGIDNAPREDNGSTLGLYTPICAEREAFA